MQATKEQALIGQLSTEGNDIIVIAGAGCGKEQPISSIIKTPTGDRLLGDLVIGDRVLGRDGKPCTVLDITYQGVKDVYEVTFRDGSKTRCGLNHNWSVLYNYAPRAKFTVKTTEQLLKAGLRKSNGDCKYQIPVCSAVQYGNTVELPLHPYILGVFLGDGSYQNSTACLSCHKEDVGILHKVQQLFKEHHEIDLLLNPRATSENGLQTTLVICSDNSKNPITALLDVLNLKRNKHIPDVYMLGTAEQRLDLLRGLMDTDGSCSKNRTVFCNTNRAIIERVVELVQSLGGTAIETEADTRKEADCFRLNIKLPINPFLLERKAVNWSYSWKNPPSRYIFSIEKLNYQEEQRCLTVSAEDSLYLTDNFIVTHNSSTLRLQAEALLPLSKNLLVLTFNAANAEETREHPDRPSNLFACTVHSLAYRALGLRKTANYLAWEDIPMEELTELSKQLAVSPKEQKTVLTLLRNGVTKAVVNYCQSGSRAILDNLPKYLGWYFQSDEVNLSVTEEQVDIVASVVLEYWAWLSKDSNKEKWTPDVYLKIYQLTRPKLKQVFDATTKDWVDIHAVALDEAQDTNGVTEAIFSYQRHLQRFIVGDPNQQLYRWRGAGRAMDNFPTFTPAFLSTSFRFNSEIARMANIVLKMNDSPFLLTGSGTKTTIDTKAILCRTNAAVVQYLFAYAMQGKERIYCSLNLKQTFSKLYHLNSCYFNEAPKYPNSELHRIKDRQSLEEAVAHSEELQRLVKLNLALTKQAGSLSKAKALIEKVLVSSMSEASLCISTVHASKGLEYCEVTLAEDFIKLPEDEPVDVTAVLAGDVDLRCCLYVAISRARVKFNPPWYLKELLSCN